MRFTLWQMFDVFTTLALIIGFAVLVFKTNDVRITILAIICLVLFSWLKNSHPTT